MMLSLPTAAAALFAAALLATSPRAAAADAASYTFKQAPVNAAGITSLEELRGKPVLIDFWGTR